MPPRNPRLRLETLEERTVLSGAPLIPAHAPIAAIVQVHPASVHHVVAPPHVVNAVFHGVSSVVFTSVRVTFDRPINPKTLTPIDVTLDTPAVGLIAPDSVAAVPGSGNRIFDIFFTPQTSFGLYTLRISSAVRDWSGHALRPYQTHYRLPAASTGQTFTQNGPEVIAPHRFNVSLLSINRDLVIGDIKVRVDINYPRLSNLKIHLQAPDGTDVLLFNRKGGWTANLAGTTFDDQAANPIAFGRGPFTGSWQPETPLFTLAGKNARGRWKLWVEDRAGAHLGVLRSWSLIITPRTGG
jgi:subtilisin-like proprotein convertase family protein